MQEKSALTTMLRQEFDVCVWHGQPTAGSRSIKQQTNGDLAGLLHTTTGPQRSMLAADLASTYKQHQRESEGR